MSSFFNLVLYLIIHFERIMDVFMFVYVFIHFEELSYLFIYEIHLLFSSLWPLGSLFSLLRMTSYSWFQSKLDQRWGYILHANVWPLEWKTESGHGLSLCLTLRLSLEGPWNPWNH